MSWYREFYCACGSYYKASGWGENPDKALAEFRGLHCIPDDGHWEVDPATCAKARRKHQRDKTIPVSPAEAWR